MRQFRTEIEQQVGARIGQVFSQSPDSVEIKLENFPKYVRRNHLKRFLAFYEIFKMALPVKGSIIDCGVYRGFSLMAWAKLSTILEPENLTRRIYGFDTFEGYPAVDERDQNDVVDVVKGGMNGNSYEELTELIHIYDQDRFLGHMDKVHLIRGDAVETIPQFVEDKKHLIVSVLFLDFDLYQPTRVALEHFVPRIPKGGLIVFDELDNPMWPGEALAAIDAVGLSNLRLQRLDWDPYIAYAFVE